MRYLIAALCTTTLLFMPAASTSAADGKNATYTDPQEAGFDFTVQGEYAGEFADGTDRAGEKAGAQVIALGNGKFDIVGYVGGLPGDGWTRDDRMHRATGVREGDVVVVTPSDPDSPTTAKIADGKLTIYLDAGDKLAELKKVERKSPTLGAKPPTEAVVLFDGSGVEQFEDAKLIDGKLLGATNCYSKQKFGDHHLHLEFRTPFMPEARGQGRGNSGVYMQSRYELQVLDSFGLDGADNECGGIYSINRPKLNMCYPPLSWQTYDIDFTAARYDESGKKVKNARATIRHNGVVIHDDLELVHGTPGRFQEGPGPEALFLQNHGNPVAFRNIWVVEKQ